MTYDDFLNSKALIAPSTGVKVSPDDLNPRLYPFQRAIVSWALEKGRAALFEDTGLGKTPQQLEFALKATHTTGQPALILAPLAVSEQTVQLGAEFGYEVTAIRTMGDMNRSGINITNYENFHNIDPTVFGAVVLDEGHILANFSGKTKQALVAGFKNTPFRLSCTATPTPNDTVELTNQGDFLSVMKPSDMLNIFFTTRTKDKMKQAAKFYLKPNAEEDFYRFLASWAVAIKRPSDLGSHFSDEGYVLPPLEIKKAIVPSDYVPEGKLFMDKMNGVTERAKVRRETLESRVKRAVEIVTAEPGERWIVWCGLNDESKLIASLIPGAVEVTGSDSPTFKAEMLLKFAAGHIPVLVTKPGIAGAGLNFQKCSRMVFCGLGDSYRDYYQCIRRCYRFRQEWPVIVWVVLSDKEEEIYYNVLRKERESGDWSYQLTSRMAGNQLGLFLPKGDYNPKVDMLIPNWLRSVA